MKKTIEVTEEQYNFLIDLARRLATQDNRITADPIFCVYDKERVLKPAGYGDHVGYVNEGHIYLLEELKEDIEDYRKEHSECCEMSDEEVIEDALEYTKLDFSIEDVPVSGQHYFSEKAAQAHIDRNDYHYHQPFTFVESAWRNYEWQMIREIILSLNKEEEA